MSPSLTRVSTHVLSMKTRVAFPHSQLKSKIPRNQKWILTQLLTFDKLRLYNCFESLISTMSRRWLFWWEKCEKFCIKHWMRTCLVPSLVFSSRMVNIKEKEKKKPERFIKGERWIEFFFFLCSYCPFYLHERKPNAYVSSSCFPSLFLFWC